MGGPWEVRVQGRLAEVGGDRQDALAAGGHRHREVGHDRRLALTAVGRGHRDHDGLAIADAEQRERGTGRAERLDERRGALEVADDVAGLVQLVEAGRRDRADGRHAVGRLDIVDRDQPAVQAGPAEGGGDTDQEAGDCAEHGIARRLGLEGGSGQTRRIADDEVAVGDDAIGLRERELVAQAADRRRGVAPDRRGETRDLRLDRVDARVDGAALQGEPELAEDPRDDARAVASAGRGRCRCLDAQEIRVGRERRGDALAQLVLLDPHPLGRGARAREQPARGRPRSAGRAWSCPSSARCRPRGGRSASRPSGSARASPARPHRRLRLRPLPRAGSATRTHAAS